MKVLLPLLAALSIAAPAQASTELEHSIRLFCTRAAVLNAAGYFTAPGTHVAAYAAGRLHDSRFTYAELWYGAKASGVDACRQVW
jgi:hypothetical protein